MTGKEAFPMGSRSCLFPADERLAVALLSPHCSPTPPPRCGSDVYHPRPSHMEKLFGKKGGGAPRVVEGLPG
jgi:hypothetical protein